MALDDERYMEEALIEAQKAAERGEIPVGAVLVYKGDIIARAGNTRELDNDALGHAEINAIRQACETLKTWRLTGCTLYVTLEPCPMCAGAIMNARIDRVVYGAADGAGGCLGSKIHLYELGFNHRPIVKRGVLEQRSLEILRVFFNKIRTDN